MSLSKHDLVSRNWFRWLASAEGQKFQAKMASNSQAQPTQTKTVTTTPHAEPPNQGKK